MKETKIMMPLGIDPRTEDMKRRELSSAHLYGTTGSGKDCYMNWVLSNTINYVNPDDLQIVYFDPAELPCPWNNPKRVVPHSFIQYTLGPHRAVNWVDGRYTPDRYGIKPVEIICRLQSARNTSRELYPNKKFPKILVVINNFDFYPEEEQVRFFEQCKLATDVYYLVLTQGRGNYLVKDDVTEYTIVTRAHDKKESIELLGTDIAASEYADKYGSIFVASSDRSYFEKLKAPYVPLSFYDKLAKTFSAKPNKYIWYVHAALMSAGVSNMMFDFDVNVPVDLVEMTALHRGMGKIYDTINPYMQDLKNLQDQDK